MNRSEVFESIPDPEKFDLLGRLHEAGMPIELLGDTVLWRLNFLFHHSNVIEDEMRAVKFAKLIVRTQKRGSENFLSPEQLRDLNTATVLTDIGKTGPLRANEQQVFSITKFFSVDRRFSSTGSVADFATNFLTDPEVAVVDLNALGIPPETPIRKLWDAHVGWSKELLATSQLPKEVQLSASLHHLLETPDPFELVGPDGCFLDPTIGRKIDQREIFIILLDKFDACLRRGNKKHDEAVAWIREYLEKNENLKKFPVWLKEKFLSCLADLDIALRPAAKKSEAK